MYESLDKKRVGFLWDLAGFLRPELGSLNRIYI